MVFDSISSNIYEVLLINSSANVFVLGNFNVHHKDWLTYSGELCYNFSISNNLTQIVNFPTHIPKCESHSPALLDLFLSSDIRNSDHVVSVSIDFPINSKQVPCFITWLMTILVLIGMVFMIIREMFYGRISLNSVLLLLLVNFASGFRLELMYISLIVSIRSNLTHLHGFQQLVLLP